MLYEMMTNSMPIITFGVKMKELSVGVLYNAVKRLGKRLSIIYILMLWLVEVEILASNMF